MLSTLLIVAALMPSQPAEKPFRITVLDDRTGRGVPLVELRTVNDIAYYTDSNGIVAFDEPGLINKDVFFHVASHGYEFPKDGFGFRGKALKTVPGGAVELKIKRLNLAERLYRITGAGIYRDTVLTGGKPPTREPLINSLVLGSDSVLNAVYRGKIHWFWGDTNRPDYPLGNFQVPGATSSLPAYGGLDPEVGIDLTYFLDAKGFAKETMKMPGTGPTWMTTLIALPDAKGVEQLYASYIKIEPPLKTYARGLAIFDVDKQTFRQLLDVDMKLPAFASGHAFRHRDDRGEHVYFAHPLPLTRVRATAESFLRPEEYETYTCLKPGSRLEKPQLDRDEAERLRYAWRKNAPALDPQSEGKLLSAGRIKPSEVRWRLRERDTGKVVVPHAGSVYWNEHRRCWVLIATQHFGSSLLGEVWYAEADTPIGPWLYAVKIVTHDRYSFYNPKQHPMFDKDGGRVIFFEGTYTHTFSGNAQKTPRYEYNQIMYRLDLADTRLSVPRAVSPSEGKTPFAFGTAKTPTFFALDRPMLKSVPIIWDGGGLKIGVGKSTDAVFHALRTDSGEARDGTTPLWEYRRASDGRRVYAVGDAGPPGWQKSAQPLCRVWAPTH